MLTQDISKDYLGIDYLQSVTYYVRLTESTWDTGHSLNNCWFADVRRVPVLSDADLKKKWASLTIWMKEWFDDTIIPKHGDKFTISEPQTDNNSTHSTTNTYLVNWADIDPFRSKAMRLTCYRLDGS